MNYLAVLLWLAAHPVPSHAAPPADTLSLRPERFFWLETGLGGPGIAGLAQLNYQTRKRILSWQVLARDSQSGLFETPRHSAVSFGLLYGATSRHKSWFFSASAGLGIVRGYQRGRRTGSGWLGPDYELNYYTTVGVPAQAQIALQSRYVGIGLSAFTNLSPKNAFGGLLVSLQLGKLRPKRLSH